MLRLLRLASVAAVVAVVAAPAQAAVPQDLRLVNYYPAHAGWTYMWERWDPAAIDADIARIAALHANSVRLIAQVPAFGWPEGGALYRARLEQAVSLAAAHGLRVELTLFDWFDGYDDVAGSELWAASVLAPYANDPRLAAVELQNELDAANPAAVAWARTLLPVVRRLAGAIPVTISVGGRDPIEGIRTLRRALAPQSLPDFWSFHYYDKAELSLGVLAAARDAAAPQPLFVGETGYWDGASDPPVATEAEREDEQVRYFRTVEAAARRLALPTVAPWALSDFAPDGVPVAMKSPEYHFGLYRVDGSPKPAAAAVRRLFAGAQDRGGFNRGFEDALPGDRTRLASWHGPGSRDARVAHTGRASATIAAGGRLWTIPTTPWVTPGARLAATAWARGAGARISVLFFDATRALVGRADSASGAGTATWTRLRAAAVVPPTAAYVRLELSTASRAWFDDVTLG